MTDEDIRYWLGFAMLDGTTAWQDIYYLDLMNLVSLGYIKTMASHVQGSNKIIVTNIGRQFFNGE
jgi:hypothetical protein